jgi:hypothetical protein
MVSLQHRSAASYEDCNPSQLYLTDTREALTWLAYSREHAESHVGAREVMLSSSAVIPISAATLAE